MDYESFLKEKIKFVKYDGFTVEQSALNDKLKPHQKDIVQWCLERGRAAIFSAFGLGKTWIQTEILKQVHNKEGGKHLIVAPLGVRQEFKRDGVHLDVDYRFVRRSEEVIEDGFYITNYESLRDGKLNPDLFTSVSLDEASVLRSYGSKTYQNFLILFNKVKYRFVATATPSPNRYKELIHYAGFLGIMDTGQALTRFFQRDSTKANNLTLYPHMEKEFYLWLHSWAIFLQKPSDLGYDDAGYDLPEIKVHYHKVKSDITTDAVERDGQSIMFKDVTMNLQSAAKEKRDSLDLRVEKMMEIINADKDNHYLLWHDLEAERHAIKKALPESKDVYGSLDLEEREKRIIDFADGKFQYLSTKPRISGSGCNFQRHCHKAIFLGIGHKFNDFIQSIYRINRFLQKHTVEIHIIYTENETEVLKSLQTKWNQDNKLRDIMTEIIKKYKLSTTDLEAELTRNLGVARQVVKGENFTIAHNDCVDECSHLKDDSIDLIHTSIPFGNHYEYSANYNDFGHNDSNPNFFKQMDFLTPELLRVLKPGRIAAIHVKDRVRFGNVTGYGMPSIDPFHVDTIQHFRHHGFIYMGMVTIVTDVVRENNQTYRLGWTENCKDGTKMGVGCPEYVLLFRKLPTDTTTAYADNPVMKNKDDYTRGRWQIDAHAFWRSSGNRFLTADEVSGYKDKDIGKYFAKKSLESIYDYEAHVKVAEDLDKKGDLPSTYMSVAPGSHDETCWHDVSRMHTLNGNQSQRGLSNHICPLQFDIVDRIITRYTNEGDVVFDPFGGIMTVPYRALKLKRKAHASELNYDYFKDGLFYLEKAENDMLTPTLFELEDLA